MIRYAIVTGYYVTTSKVGAHLPSNYKVLGTDSIKTTDSPMLGNPGFYNDEHVVVISGRDVDGWTLDGYVIPRLGSGNMAATEIDLSHPVMSQFDL
jgi:secreted trypsin-like serine protease